MMEENVFFTIKSRKTDEEGKELFLIHLCEGHKVYEGHFPGKPVCPGVMTLSVVRQCAEQIAGRSLKWSEIKNCRFTGMLFPGYDVLAIVSMCPEENTFTVCAELVSPDNYENQFLTLKGTLQ